MFFRARLVLIALHLCDRVRHVARRVLLFVRRYYCSVLRLHRRDLCDVSSLRLVQLPRPRVVRVLRRGELLPKRCDQRRALCRGVARLGRGKRSARLDPRARALLYREITCHLPHCRLVRRRGA